MSDMALDQRLRPAVEANSAIVAGFCAFIAFTMPWALMLPPLLGAVMGLMATAFALGAMNPWWMAVLGIVALLEQTVPQAELLRRAVGGALLLAGIWQWA